jgi:hypothetical protein
MWQELPPKVVKLSCFNNHASIRKLLIKLGGKFSDVYDLPIHQFETSATQQIYQSVN